MDKQSYVEQYINNNTGISKLLQHILDILSESSNVYIFGGLLREIVNVENADSITDYLLNQNGDVDIIVNNFNDRKFYNTMYTLLFCIENNIKITRIKSDNYSFKNKKFDLLHDCILNTNKRIKIAKQLNLIGSHTAYTFYNDTFKLKVDILHSDEPIAFLKQNMDVSMNALVYNYKTNNLFSKNENIIKYDQIIDDIINKNIRVLQVMRFSQIIDRIVKLINKGYNPDYTDIYTYNYILSRLILIFQKKKNLVNYMPIAKAKQLFQNIDSNLLYNILIHYNKNCFKCKNLKHCNMFLCNDCNVDYYNCNIKILKPINISNNILLIFIKFAIYEFNCKLYKLIIKLITHKVYHNVISNKNMIYILRIISKQNNSKIIQFIIDCNILKTLDNVQTKLLLKFCINARNDILFTYLYNKDIREIFHKYKYENILDYSYKYTNYKISKLLVDSDYKIDRINKLFLNVCMTNNLEYIKLYIESCNSIDLFTFNEDLITNMIINLNFDIIKYFQRIFNINFSTRNIETYIQMIYQTSKKLIVTDDIEQLTVTDDIQQPIITDHTIKHQIIYAYNLSYLLSHYSNKIDIYNKTDWRYNSLPVYIIENYSSLFYILVDKNIRYNKLINFIMLYRFSYQIEIHKILLNMYSYYRLRNIDLVNKICDYL